MKKKLIQNFIDYLETISLSVYRLVKEKFHHNFEALENSENVRKENLLKEFDSYSKELIVLESNSSSYDYHTSFVIISISQNFSYFLFRIILILL